MSFVGRATTEEIPAATVSLRQLAQERKEREQKKKSELSTAEKANLYDEMVRNVQSKLVQLQKDRKEIEKEIRLFRKQFFKDNVEPLKKEIIKMNERINIALKYPATVASSYLEQLGSLFNLFLRLEKVKKNFEGDLFELVQNLYSSQGKEKELRSILKISQEELPQDVNASLEAMTLSIESASKESLELFQKEVAAIDLLLQNYFQELANVLQTHTEIVIPILEWNDKWKKLQQQYFKLYSHELPVDLAIEMATMGDIEYAKTLQ